MDTPIVSYALVELPIPTELTFQKLDPFRIDRDGIVDFALQTSSI